MSSFSPTDFPLDPGVAYLNAAYMTPLPHAVRAAGEAGLLARAQPWRRDRDASERVVEETRAMAAALIHAQADDIALGGAVSYGLATAAANLTLQPGQHILLVEGEHYSMTFAMRALAERHGAALKVVPRPDDGDWTAALLRAIAAGGDTIALAALTPVHWVDGILIDLERVAPALRAAGARLLVDATQAAGVLAIDVRTLQPDYVMFPAYKWLLGPYGFAFLYVAPHLQGGTPLEEHAFNRDGVLARVGMDASLAPYRAGARRFDRGERDGYIAIPMVHAGLAYLAQWPRAALAAHCQALTERLAAAVAALGIVLPAPALRSPHILSIPVMDQTPDRVADQLTAAGVVTTVRYQYIRVSPHLYNTEGDIDHAADAFQHRMSIR